MRVFVQSEMRKRLWSSSQRKNPTNIKQHLKCHKDEYRTVIEEEKAKSAETKETSIAKSKSRQAAITSMLHVRPFSKDSMRYKDITCKFALFIGTRNVPYSLVENSKFHDLLQSLKLHSNNVQILCLNIP